MGPLSPLRYTSGPTRNRGRLAGRLSPLTGKSDPHTPPPTGGCLVPQPLVSHTVVPISPAPWGCWVPQPLLSHTVAPTRPRARGWWDHLFRNIINFLINSHHNHQQSPSSSCKWPSWIEPHVITAVAGASRGVRDRGRGWFSLGSHVTWTETVENQGAVSQQRRIHALRR